MVNLSSVAAFRGHRGIVLHCQQVLFHVPHLYDVLLEVVERTTNITFRRKISNTISEQQRMFFLYSISLFLSIADEALCAWYFVMLENTSPSLQISVGCVASTIN